MENDNNSLKMPAPHANLILAFGIMSIITFCCCSGVLGIIFSIIAIILAQKSKREFTTNSDLYDENTFGKVSTGKTCAIIGLVLSIIVFIIAIVFMNTIDTNEFLSEYNGWNRLGY